MKVYFITSQDGAKPGATLFQGEDYIPRLGDFIRAHTNIYKVVHVEWVYLPTGGKPLHVEVLLQPIKEGS